MAERRERRRHGRRAARPPWSAARVPLVAAATAGLGALVLGALLPGASRPSSAGTGAGVVALPVSVPPAFVPGRPGRPRTRDLAR